MSDSLLRVVTVFLASPSDLRSERRAIHEMVGNFNKKLAKRVGFLIELLRWEDEYAKAGRPQQHINRHVDQCAVFIGMLNRQWGTPTGSYDSGFHEEYDRALTRNSTTGNPELWLFFKRLPPESVKDPGVQLQQVLEFRDQIVTEHTALYREFKSANEIVVMIEEQLTEYVLNRYEELQRESTHTASGTAVQPGELIARPESAGTSSMAGLLPDLSSALASNACSPPELVRLYSLGAAHLYRTLTVGVLGSHEANLLYLYRQDVEMTPPESQLIIRTMLADSGNLIPMWYWTTGDGGNYLNTCANALFDGSAPVRQGALRLLVRHNSESALNPARAMLTDADSSVRKTAADVIVLHGTRDDIALLETAAAADGNAYTIDGRHPLLALARFDADAAVRTLASSGGYFADTVLGAVSKADLAASTLAAGLQSSSADVRAYCADELCHRGDSLDDLRSLVQDSDGRVKACAIKAILLAGVRPNPAEFDALLEGVPEKRQHALKQEYLSGVERDILVARLDWSLDGADTYQVLAQHHFEWAKDMLITDVQSDFGRLRQAALDAHVQSIAGKLEPDTTPVVRQAAVEAIRQRIEKSWSGVDEFIRCRFLKAALAGIELHGDPEVAPVVREAAKRGMRYNPDSITSALAAVGDSSDVPSLIAIARGAVGSEHETAAAAALSLTNDTVQTAQDILEIGQVNTVRTALWAVHAVDQDAAKAMCRSLLTDKSDELRVVGIAHLSRLLAKPELESLLQEVLGRSQYYYNVICWLDRILYAPLPLESAFQSELELIRGAEPSLGGIGTSSSPA